MSSAAVEAALSKLKVYKGRDLNTINEPVCWNCHERPTTTLSPCARCRLAWYCDRDCQKDHFVQHRRDCREMKKSTALLEKRRLELENMELMWGVGPNAFETCIGNFSDIVETRDYMRARHLLALQLHQMAYKVETEALWKALLDHHLETLRLCRSDDTGLRNHVPSVLLALNRDDDCYKFIRWWALEMSHDRDDDSEESVPEGTWIYNVDMDRFGDPVNGDIATYTSLSHKIAMLVVKLRIVAAHEQHVKMMSHGMKTSLNRVVRERLAEKMVSQDIRRQRMLLDRYLRLVHSHNKHMLPGYMDPGPMRELGQPDMYGEGDFEEAQLNLDKYCRHIHRIPGAEAKIRAFLTKATGRNEDSAEENN